jgi:hypothetical protein
MYAVAVCAGQHWASMVSTQQGHPAPVPCCAHTAGVGALLCLLCRVEHVNRSMAARMHAQSMYIIYTCVTDPEPAATDRDVRSEQRLFCQTSIVCMPALSMPHTQCCCMAATTKSTVALSASQCCRHHHHHHCRCCQHTPVGSCTCRHHTAYKVVNPEPYALDPRCDVASAEPRWKLHMHSSH